MSKNLILFQNKLDRLIQRINGLMASNISYEDKIETELLSQIVDILDNPHALTIKMKPAKIDDGLSSSEWNNFQLDMMGISITADKILTSVGEDLNKAVIKASTMAVAADTLLKKEIKRLSVSEQSVLTYTNNNSISSERRYSSDDITEYEGDAEVGRIITFKTDTTTRVEPRIVAQNIVTPNKETRMMKIKTHDTIGKSDSEVFLSGYYEGRLFSTNKYGGPSIDTRDIRKAFDQKIDQYAEFEYISFSKPTNNEPFIAKFIMEINTAGYNNISIRSFSNADEIVKVSYDNGNTWSESNIRDSLKYNDTIKDRYYIIESQSNDSILVEVEFITILYEKLMAKRVVANIGGIKKKLNYFESVILESNGIAEGYEISRNFNIISKRLECNRELLYDKAKRSPAFNYKLDDLEIGETEIYRYVITIPEIFVERSIVSEIQTHYISQEIISDSDIQAVELETVLDYPISKLSADFEWFEFYISADKEKWSKIRPTTSSITIYNDQIPDRVIYNNLLGKSNNSIDIKTQNTKSVYLKIVMNRTSESGIPSLENYTLRTKVV